MIFLRLIVACLAVGTFASFIWAVRRFFVTQGEPATGMRAIAAGGTAAMVLHLASIALLAPPDPLWPAAGALLFDLALFLFWGAIDANRQRPLTLAFTGDRPDHLVMRGPYAYVRHPFYAAYLIAWLAGAVATAEPLLLLTFFGMGALYFAAARAEEAKFAASPLGPAYAEYRRRTGMFVPRLLRSETPEPTLPESRRS